MGRGRRHAPAVCFAARIALLWYTLIGCASTMAVGYLASLAEPSPPEEVDGLTWGVGSTDGRKPVESPA